MRHPPPSIADELRARPTSFVVGAHTVVVAQIVPSWRWTVTVDGRLLDATFQSQAAAWEAGVHEAGRSDEAAAPG